MVTGIGVGAVAVTRGVWAGQGAAGTAARPEAAESGEGSDRGLAVPAIPLKAISMGVAGGEPVFEGLGGL